MPSSPLPLADDRLHLRADCARCAGLCCVAPAFAASADFAVDKPAGTPCRHLSEDFHCGIHDRLRDRGFPGCDVFDCFGAGQRITQQTFGGRSWREDPELAQAQFAVLPVMRQLHEMLWYLTEVRTYPVAESLREEAGRLLVEVTELTRGTADELAALDVGARRAEVGEFLGRVSAGVRAGTQGQERRAADLVGRDLRRTRLRDAGLRGALLIGADLRGVDLGRADLLGGDLRGADVRRADLSGCLFLTQSQVSAAQGDASTRIPAGVRRPAHWS